jgi:hypothetical protein
MVTRVSSYQRKKAADLPASAYALLSLVAASGQRIMTNLNMKLTGPFCVPIDLCVCLV